MILAQISDSGFLELGKQVPALVVLCVLAYLFLKQMGEARADYLASLKLMHDENIEARVLSQAIIKENTIATQAMTAQLSALSNAVQKMEHK